MYFSIANSPSKEVLYFSNRQYFMNIQWRHQIKPRIWSTQITCLRALVEVSNILPLAPQNCTCENEK